MPQAPKFIRGYKIQRGMKIADMQISEITVGHNQIVQFRRYEYPIRMTLKTKSRDMGFIINELKRYLGGKRKINSEYDNPYECMIDTDKLLTEINKSGDIVVLAKGVCWRVFDVKR